MKNNWINFLWTFFQNLLGLIVVLITNAKKEERTFCQKTYSFYVAKRFNHSWSGVSLGMFVIFACETDVNITSVKHEYGHQLQSVYLGPFYMLVIGLPSMLGNIWNRIAHRNWLNYERVRWYYNLPWEHWADVLGKVDRCYL